MKNSYKLSNENIDVMSDAFTSFIEASGVEGREASRLRLSLEEVLLDYQAEFGEEAEVFTEQRVIFGKKALNIEIAGHEFDPFAYLEDGEKAILHNLYDQMDRAPHFTYQNGINKVQFTLPTKDQNTIGKIMAAVAFGAAFGLIFTRMIPGANQAMLDYLVSPVCNVFVAILSALACPMIFIFVMLGIYNIGDINTFSKIGKPMLKRIVGYTTLLAVLSAFVLIPFQTFDWDTTKSAEAMDMIHTVIGLVPTNFFTPFSRGDILQIIIIAVVLGICFITLGEKTQTIVKFFDGLNKAITIIIEAIGKFLPVFIFFGVAYIVMTKGYTQLSNIYLLVLFMIVTYVLSWVVIALTAWIEGGVRPDRFIKLSSKPFSEALRHNGDWKLYETLKEAGVSKSVMDFALPLSKILYKPAFAAELIAFAAYFVIACGYMITPVWILLGAIMCVVMSIAVPPIKGGSLICYVIFLTQLTIPAEMIILPVVLTALTENIRAGQSAISHLSMTLIIEKINPLKQKKL